MSFESTDLVGDGTSPVLVENTDVEKSAECALETLLRGVDALRPTGASANLLLDGGCEKANADGKHDELATAAAAKATAIMDALLDDMAGQGGEMWCALAVLWVFGRLYGDLIYSFIICMLPHANGSMTAASTKRRHHHAAGGAHNMQGPRRRARGCRRNCLPTLIIITSSKFRLSFNGYIYDSID